MVLKIEDIKKPAKQIGKAKRKGRGVGSGKGKTAGRGHKGAGQRTGSKNYLGFEGGQMPLMRRIPKRGFNNKWKKQWNVVNVGTLQNSDEVKEGAVVDKDFLLKNRMIRKKDLPCKVLGKGKLEKAVTVKADSFSETARKAIEGAGGKAETA
ncbi:MAG: 50S ribosomal protein L15 [Candidatus Omnitrophica bacterium]|nr:50S ribosomal protein L15 [Candidatus Omnitrophota bacterium]